MVIFELAVLLAICSVAAFPCWQYSADWGYLPSAVAGFLLVVVMGVAATDRAPERLARNGVATPTIKVAAAPTTDANRRHSGEIIDVAKPVRQ